MEIDEDEEEVGMSERELLKRIAELEERATVLEKRNRLVLKDQIRQGMKDLAKPMRAEFGLTKG